MNQRKFRSSLKAGFAALAFGASCAWGAPTFVPGDQPFGDVPQLALTGFNLSTGTQKAFQVYFDANSWAGDVSAYPIGTNGQTQIVNKLWSAAGIFGAKQACFGTDPAPASLTYYDTGRNIVTRDGATNIPFRWAAGGLSDTQKGTLDADITAGGKGDKIHKYIRGNRSNEIFQQIVADDLTITSSCGSADASIGIFRPRVSILGDNIHARPVFVGPPPADFTFDFYPDFKLDHVSRPHRLFVASNDGMVHGFDADDGRELWAYIPSMLIGNLKKLSVDPYAHTYFVDGQLTAGDVKFGDNATKTDWHTVIVGGLGAGGKGLFALDVTSADAADETEAKAKILWEITPTTTGNGTASTDYADLGFTYGTPVIARMNTGQWVAIVNNGYLNGGSEKAVLYIINIKTGALIQKLNTGSGTVGSPNGLSSPIAIDTTFDGKIDRIYAGDIDGNVWKFDVSGITAASWVPPGGSPPTKLFPIAGDFTAADTSAGITAQAILGAPDVAAHPISGFLVYFATGRMLTSGDASSSTVQNFAYGVWDGAPGANTTFRKQTLTERLHGTQRVRVSSGLPVNWNNTADLVNNPVHKGWRTALPAGERVIGTGFVRDARYQFTAVNPTIDKTPDPNGENWLIELDFLTGGAADKPVFDLSADSLLTDADRVKYVAADTLPAGKAIGDPIAGTVGIPVAVYMGAGLLSQPVLANVSAQLSTTLFNDNPFTSPADQPAVPPPPPTERGVAGGHFDVEIYYAAAGDTLCNYDSTGGSAAVKAVGWIDFTYGGNKVADPLSITVDGVELLTQNNPGNKSRSNLEDWIENRVTTAISALWDIRSTSSGSPSGNNAIRIRAVAGGTALNGKVITVTTGSGMDSTHYTITTPTAAGVAAIPAVLEHPALSCGRNLHVHEYDEVYNVTGVNMLNASNVNLNMSKAIPSTSTNFKVIVSNQYLSPAVTLSIGGAPHISLSNVNTSSTIDLATIPTYNRNTITTFEYNMPVNAFSSKAWWTAGPASADCTTNTAEADCRVGLHPVAYKCVTQADEDEGGNLYFPAIPPAAGSPDPAARGYQTSAPFGTRSGVRHNGALTFQLVKDTTPNSALELAVAGRPEFGWRLKEDQFEDYLVAQWTTFWHHPSDICYHQAGWTKQAPPDTSPPNTSVFKTPTAGSADPGASTVRVTITGTPTTNTNTVGGVTTTVVTTNYSNGSSLVVTTVTTGGVSTTTSQFVPAPGGGGGTPPPGGTPVGQAVSSPNTITGYQQTRNSGKLGRVTWRELLRQ